MKQQKISQKILLVLASTLVIVTVFSATAHAAEISPDSDSISYGSTSENSASLEINPNGTSVSSGSSSTLANTGQSTLIIAVGAGALVILGLGLALHQRIKK